MSNLVADAKKLFNSALEQHRGMAPPTEHPFWVGLGLVIVTGGLESVALSIENLASNVEPTDTRAITDALSDVEKALTRIADEMPS